jgi:hypothetical protein
MWQARTPGRTHPAPVVTVAAATVGGFQQSPQRHDRGFLLRRQWVLLLRCDGSA